MKNHDDIVIPRAELPKVSVEILGGAVLFRPEGPKPVSYRAKALESLALAEAMDRHIRIQESEKDEKNLHEEAQALSKAAGATMLLAAARPWEVEYWYNVARAARELHGK